MKRKEFAAFIFALGLWMLASALTFGQVGSKMFNSDIISGVLLLAFASVAHFPHHTWSLWSVAALGIWMQMAPLALWTHQVADYINGTLTGFFAMAIALRTMTPQLLPNREGAAPHGWSFNPSGWSFRIPLIFFALICSFVARYMAAFQLGLIPEIHDPVFGEGTYNVITSPISHAFPVSDAGLGALAYLIEVLMGCEGDVERWRTRPWAVMVFGILVIPVSIISTILIILQPVVVGSWCFWCLLTAFLMVIMIPLALPEFVAGIHFLHYNRRLKKNLWRLLWHGDEAHAKIVSSVPATRGFSLQGVTLPWNLILSAMLGIWMIVSASKSPDYIVGPLVFVVSILACAEIARSARLLNIRFGIWILLLPWMSSMPTPKLINHELVGLALILLAFRRGPIRQRYGVLQRFII